jgi:hypothetical protein
MTVCVSDSSHDPGFGVNMSAVAEKPVSIYALVDPRTDQIKYIGKSVKPEKRFRDHVSPFYMKAETHKNHWLRQLDREGLKPRLKILHEVPAHIANEAEEAAIMVAKIFGDRLTNGTNGGDGGAITDPNAKARMGFRQKHSDETRTQMSASAKRRCADPAEVERLRSISNGTPPVHAGEKNSMAVLSDAQVKELRERHAAGESCVSLARAYGRNQANVTQIVTGQVRMGASGPIRDAAIKQRLTDEQVDEIRNRVAGGESQSEVAKAFRVDVSHVNKICHGNARKKKSIPPHKEA